MFRRSSTVMRNVEPLKYATGAEKTESVVIDPATVTANAAGRKIVPAAALVVRKTTGGMAGPFASGATDGRQTLANSSPPTVFITSAEIDVTDGPRAIGAYFGGAAFDSAHLTLYGATLTAARAALPTCEFL
jgi:hypothetical protein